MQRKNLTPKRSDAGKPRRKQRGDVPDDLVVTFRLARVSYGDTEEKRERTANEARLAQMFEKHFEEQPEDTYRRLITAEMLKRKGLPTTQPETMSEMLDRLEEITERSERAAIRAEQVLTKLEKLSGKLVLGSKDTGDKGGMSDEEDEDNIPRVNPSVLAMMGRMVQSGRKN